MMKPLAYALAALCLLLSSSASAHFDQDTGAGDYHKSRYGRTAIKQGPCGLTDGERGSNVHTYAPGETITIGINEYIPHPGYFRIAFDDDGDDDFADPATIDPHNRSCLADEAHCGASDYFNNDTVLMDELEWDRPYPALNAMFEWEVTLPDVECDNCTLQIIQVMTDDGKAPYDPSAAGADDLYYQCVDLVLDASSGGDGATDADAGTGAGVEGASNDGGGCMVMNAGAGGPADEHGRMPAAAIALGLAAWIRRRLR